MARNLSDSGPGIGTGKEIDQRLRDLQRSEELYRSAIACSPLAMASLDLDGSVWMWNASAEKMFGWSVDEVLGKHMPIIPEQSEEEFATLRRHVARGQTLMQHEVVRQNRQGVLMDLSISAAPIRDRHNQVIGILAMIEDITRRKAIENQVRQLNAQLERRVAERTRELELANQELEAFAYSVSHDLRAPLRAIDGWAQVLLEEHGETLGEDGRQLIARQRLAGQRMGVLIDDLIQLAKLSQASVDRQQVEMCKIAHQAWQEVVSHGAAENPPKFQLGPMPTCYADPSLLLQLYVNLLSNALKFSSRHPDPQIEVGFSTRSDGQHVYFVKDNGAGFQMRYVDKLFQPFQRLHSPKEFPGTGIGLAIVKRIVQRHAGQVWATGLKGHGATFYFTVPS